ncbi:GlxA family transcriptional regulator [Gordonia soli]|uniref:Putative AraC family transcriptional regulator n=1 Tax=Gordonia soli NBRC 108243 TaxID=1223545 RepID=M0QEB1_9ACTN|nr:helix-turn-helix domain-containing protein [Gordonia soli]GAC66784.1 putative AraC family transcriptional regulator [Gordonia soli NBRC 108243]
MSGGSGAFDIDADGAPAQWLRDVAAGGTRILSVCTGAFLAARISLLDGCTATTHWAYADRLATEFPLVTVDADWIFVQSTSRVWTSAGVSAGIDLSLAAIEQDHGTELAQTVARWLVLHLRRTGGQTQFAPPVWIPRATTPPVRAVQDAVDENPAADHSVPAMAERASMSVRNFSRVFTAEVGEPPSRYVEKIRTEAARRHLESTSDTGESIASRCGFTTAESMRRTFHRRVGVAPDHYRETFGPATRTPTA